MQRVTALLQRMVTTRPKTTRPLWLLMARSLKSKIRRQRLHLYQRKWARLPQTRVIFSMTERKTSRRVIPSSWKRMVRMSLQRMVTTPQRMERSSRLWMARLHPLLTLLQRSLRRWRVRPRRRLMTSRLKTNLSRLKTNLSKQKLRNSRMPLQRQSPR